MIRFSKLLVLLALSLSACVRPQNHRTDATATFILAEVKAKSTVSEYVDGFSIPKARLYNFSVCASDLRNHQPLNRSEFSISGGAKEQTLRADDSGCLNWSETIQFNFLDDEHYMEFNRTITAHGMSAGSRDIRLAIDPWAIVKGNEEVYDLNFKKIPDNMLLGKAAEASSKQFWVSKIYVENTSVQSKDFITRKLRAFIQPSLLLQDMTGHQTVIPLTEAKMKVSVDVIAIATAGGVESSFVVASEKDLPLTKDGDSWTFQFKATLRQNNQNLRYQWAMRVDPIGTQSNLKSFSGLFSAGDNSTMTGSNSIPMVLRDGNYQMKTAIGDNASSMTAARSDANGAANAPSGAGLPQAAVNNGAKPNVSDYIAKTRTFEVGEFKIEWLAVQAETATNRTVRYRGTTCISDNTNGGHAAIDVDFKVEVGEGADKHALDITKRRGPGLDGCISWEDTITHRYYETERFIVVPFTVTHEASGFIEKRNVGFDPWDRWNFGADEKVGNGLFKEFNPRNSPKSRLIVDGYQFDTVATRSYGVDSFLNLRILKRVQFRMSGRVQRHSNILAGKATNTEMLRDGIYLFRSLINVSVRKATGETTELYSPMVGRQKLARVIGGDVKLYADFNLGDPKLMRARSNLVFQILPVDESKLSTDEISTLALAANHNVDDVVDKESGLVTPTFVGPIWAGDEGGFATVFPTDLPISGSYKSIDLAENTRALAGQTFSQIMDRAKTSQTDYVKRMNEMRALPNYLKTQNLEYISLNNEAVVMAKNPGLESSNLFLPKTNTASRLLAFMNYPIKDGTATGIDPQMALSEPATAQTMQEFIEGRKALDLPMQAHLCQMFMTDIAGKAVSNQRAFFQDCLMSVAGKQSVFTMDRIVRVVESDGGQFVPGQQPTLSFSLGADVGFGRSAGKNVSWSPIAFPEKVISAVPIVGPVFSAVWGALGLSASMSRGATGTEGTHFGSGTTLTMENVGLDIKATRYETCAAIRIDPSYWESRRSRLGTSLTDEKLNQTLSRGVLICSGIEATTPLAVHENFYSFAQGALDGTSLDKGDIGNLPWLIALRGTRDYVTFLDFIQAKNGLKNDSNIVIDIGGYPMSQLAKAYGHYRSHVGSQPGFYVFPATAEAQQTPKAWWNPFR